VTRAVTFDAGQTLVELDTTMLAARCAERGLIVDAAALDAAVPGAFRHHDALVARGATHPWKQVMERLLTGAGADPAAAAPVVDWLFEQQPARNLFRRGIAGMRELVEDLHRRGVPMAVVSNSEGRLAALLDELDWSRFFVAIADSGVLGVAKPDPAIFAWTLERLGVPAGEVVHVGDSRGADVDGALAAGMRAIWFGPAAHDLGDPRVAACADAPALRARLDEWIRG
jgi:HAD superfamily hydrolase (TIGR01509 family)